MNSFDACLLAVSLIFKVVKNKKMCCQLFLTSGALKFSLLLKEAAFYGQKLCD